MIAVVASCGVAAGVCIVAMVLLVLSVYRQSDQYRLHLAKRGRLHGHLPTDPACTHHRDTYRPGQRLYEAARGYACPACFPPENNHTTGPSPW